MKDEIRETEDPMSHSDEDLKIPAPEWLGEDVVQLMELNDQIVVARAAIIDVLAEIEDITLRQNPRIEAEWQVAIGTWENRLLEAQIAMRRARRKRTLVQACVNTDTPIDMPKIEQQLDAEFEKWQRQLELAVERYQEAVAQTMARVPISLDEDRLQKTLFRKLAKRLHPDLHPDLGEKARRMFALAEVAYRQGDTAILQSLEVSTRDLESFAALPQTAIEAEAELAVTEAQLKELKDRAADLKDSKPYCLRALLDDSAWMEETVANYQRQIDECHETELRYLAECEQARG